MFSAGIFFSPNIFLLGCFGLQMQTPQKRQIDYYILTEDFDLESGVAFH